MKHYKINHSHGIMFHHFHNDVHPVGQGSISAEEFDQILNYIGISNIVSAQEWARAYADNKKLTNKVCITFDDSLKCQYDIAKPVLDKYNIKAFFFVYSSVFQGHVEFLEVFRYFRSKAFKDFNDFFMAFMNAVEKSSFRNAVTSTLLTFKPNEYLKEFSFYSENDKIFRYLRDHVLKVDGYNQIMLEMINSSGFSIEGIKDQLWMTTDEIKTLAKEGHYLGLHSHTHPTVMGTLPIEVQRNEYTANKKFLESITGKPTQTMSHPCNSYNQATLTLLENLGIDFGFRANMQSGFTSKYEIPREDHINVLKEMKENS